MKLGELIDKTDFKRSNIHVYIDEDYICRIYLNMANNLTMLLCEGDMTLDEMKNMNILEHYEREDGDIEVLVKEGALITLKDFLDLWNGGFEMMNLALYDADTKELVFDGIGDELPDGFLKYLVYKFEIKSMDGMRVFII